MSRQVDLTVAANLPSRRDVDAIARSSCRRLRRELCHLFKMVSGVCILSCMTRSHLRVHTRCADSEIIMRRRRDAPRFVFPTALSLGLFSSGTCGIFIAPQPRISPMDMVGQFPCLVGHSCFAAFQIVVLVGLVHSVSMCSIDSVSAAHEVQRAR